MENNIYDLNKLIKSSNNIVFLGGAGVSTASGIPDFRGKNGLYTTAKENDPKSTPEYMLSLECLTNEPSKFFEFHRENMNFTNIKPNVIHKKLAQLEKVGKLKAVITQNIDGLHQKAGSINVIELHGTLSKSYCVSCGNEYNGKYITYKKYADSQGIPRCGICNGLVRPDVVLYGESLNAIKLAEACDYVSKAEVLIVAGTSLRVYPAAGLINYFNGKALVILNNSLTPYDKMADIVLRSDLVDVFNAIKV